MSVESNEELTLPAITICNKTAFKNWKRNLEMNSYMENTIDLDDFLIGIDILDGQSNRPKVEKYNNKTQSAGVRITEKKSVKIHF